jgi:uncharacterized membrane protein YfcA
MDYFYYIIAAISFVASFVFALGGVGTALVMVPILVSFGIPLNIAKSVSLFNNGTSMISASVSNFRNGRLDLKFSIPFIVSSVLFAIVGAYISKFFPTHIILLIFVVFLVVSGFIFLFLGKNEEAVYRDDSPFVLLFLVGSFAGLLAGLIGIGGGSVISPIMLILGFNPKKTTTVTAFVIPFSSFSAFLTYWAMGSVDWILIVIVSVAGMIGATIGTSFMHRRLNPKAVKKVLAFILLGMAVKMIFQIYF